MKVHPESVKQPEFTLKAKVYGPPLVGFTPSTCGCAASLNRRSGLSNSATRARSCPAWSSYCRSHTDEPRGSRWRRDLCWRPCVQPWLELGKPCHWRSWRQSHPNYPPQIKFLADRIRRRRCKGCQQIVVLKKLPTAASAIPADEVQRPLDSHNWCLQASNMLVRYLINVSCLHQGTL